MIRLGTSGFSYDDWQEVVYPTGLQRWKWLSYYAAEFDTVELNVTYYRVPEAKVASGWVERTPADFVFAVKAHQGLTHKRVDPDFSGFRNGIAPLADSGKLGCILAQFPYSFRPNPHNLEYLKILRAGLEDLPTVIEFRNSAWIKEETFALLESLEFGYCCVDEPQIDGLMPPTVKATGPLAYVRFHGRNAEKWYDHEFAWERYDYEYSEEELKEWLPRLSELDRAAPITLVYANNHYRGQSVNLVRALKRLLVNAG
jgi:uncharacterized protein YecE (DUF72 family)